MKTLSAIFLILFVALCIIRIAYKTNKKSPPNPSTTTLNSASKVTPEANFLEGSSKDPLIHRPFSHPGNAASPKETPLQMINLPVQSLIFIFISKNLHPLLFQLTDNNIKSTVEHLYGILPEEINKFQASCLRNNYEMFLNSYKTLADSTIKLLSALGYFADSNNKDDNVSENMINISINPKMLEAREPNVIKSLIFKLDNSLNDFYNQSIIFFESLQNTMTKTTAQSIETIIKIIEKKIPDQSHLEAAEANSVFPYEQIADNWTEKTKHMKNFFKEAKQYITTPQHDESSNNRAAKVTTDGQHTQSQTMDAAGRENSPGSVPVEVAKLLLKATGTGAAELKPQTASPSTSEHETATQGNAQTSTQDQSSLISQIEILPQNPNQYTSQAATIEAEAAIKASSSKNAVVAVAELLIESATPEELISQAATKSPEQDKNSTSNHHSTTKKKLHKSRAKVTANNSQSQHQKKAKKETP